jgi:hypothetical protein
MDVHVYDSFCWTCVRAWHANPAKDAHALRPGPMLADSAGWHLGYRAWRLDLQWRNDGTSQELMPSRRIDEVDHRVNRILLT